MALFKSKETEKPTSGTDAIRQMLVVQNKRLNIAGLAQDLSLPSSALEDFMAGKSVPPAAALEAMSKRFWQNTQFDPENDILFSPDILPDKPFNTITITPQPRGTTPYIADHMQSAGFVDQSPPPAPLKPGGRMTTRPGWRSR